MITKEIQMQYSGSEEIQYNLAEVIELYDTGDIRCNVVFLDLEKVEGEQEVRRDTNIIFFHGNVPFELTDVDLEILQHIKGEII